jgi:hypothetical protein
MGLGCPEGRVRLRGERRFAGMTFGKRVLHGGMLAFTAFWLVATSRPQQPVVECFAPLTSRSVKVTLGAVVPPAPGAGPSCHGADGLAAGAVLRAELTRGATPISVSDGHQVCWSYEVKKLDGPKAFSNLESREPNKGEPTAYFEAWGRFDGPGTPCVCQYRLVTRLDTPFRHGLRADPKRAGPAEPWRVRRVINQWPGQSCTFTPPMTGESCEDTFEVKSIADAL